MAKKIFVIDDEDLVTKSLTKLLWKNDYHVSTAKNGEEALKIAFNEKFDLIIADIRMPGKNGVEIIQEIYGNLEKHGFKRTPVIFITGYADEEMHNRAETLKPVAYVYKPFDIVTLINVVKDVVKS